jgi:hypothetical protein
VYRLFQGLILSYQRQQLHRQTSCPLGHESRPLSRFLTSQPHLNRQLVLDIRVGLRVRRPITGLVLAKTLARIVLRIQFGDCGYLRTFIDTGMTEFIVLTYVSLISRYTIETLEYAAWVTSARNKYLLAFLTSTALCLPFDNQARRRYMILASSSPRSRQCAPLLVMTPPRA